MVFQAEDRTKAKRHQSDAAIQMALQGKWSEAVQVNKQILADFPTDVDAYNRLGKAQTELGRYNDAKKSYMKALEIDPLNSIAQKNLARLASLGKAAPARPSVQKLSPQMFIEETGKTGITTLLRPDMDVAARMTAGDQVALDAKSGTLTVRAMGGEYVGEIEPRLGQRLIKLINGGNEYVAAVSAIDAANVKMFIRETFQHAAQTGKLSFPPTVTESFRPYVKERLVRNDADDEQIFDDGEDSEDWVAGSGAAADDDDADEETGMIDLAGRGAGRGMDMDEESEE